MIGARVEFPNVPPRIQLSSRLNDAYRAAYKWPYKLVAEVILPL